MRKKIVLIFIALIATLSFSKTHKVRSGDTLSVISRKYNITINQLMARNQLSSTNIKKGAVLNVGGDGYHFVTYGENISSISKQHGITPFQLIQLNNLNNNIIRPGQKLKVTSRLEKSSIKKEVKNLSTKKKEKTSIDKAFFSIKEFVDRQTYSKYGEKSIWFIDEDLINQMNQLRELFDRKITINTWSNGGKFQWRGFRTAGSPNFSTYSSHSFGRAVDFDVEGLSGAQARRKIINWYKEGILVSKSINLETEVSWVHLDIRNGEELRTFKP